MNPATASPAVAQEAGDVAQRAASASRTSAAAAPPAEGFVFGGASVSAAGIGAPSSSAPTNPWAEAVSHGQPSGFSFSSGGGAQASVPAGAPASGPQTFSFTFGTALQGAPVAAAAGSATAATSGGFGPTTTTAGGGFGPTTTTAGGGFGGSASSAGWATTTWPSTSGAVFESGRSTSPTPKGTAATEGGVGGFVKGGHGGFVTVKGQSVVAEGGPVPAGPVPAGFSLFGGTQSVGGRRRAERPPPDPQDYARFQALRPLQQLEEIEELHEGMMFNPPPFAKEKTVALVELLKPGAGEGAGAGAGAASASAAAGGSSGSAAAPAPTVTRVQTRASAVLLELCLCHTQFLDDLVSAGLLQSIAALLHATRSSQTAGELLHSLCRIVKDSQEGLMALAKTDCGVAEAVGAALTRTATGGFAATGDKQEGIDAEEEEAEAAAKEEDGAGAAGAGEETKADEGKPWQAKKSKKEEDPEDPADQGCDMMCEMWERLPQAKAPVQAYWAQYTGPALLALLTQGADAAAAAATAGGSAERAESAADGDAADNAMCAVRPALLLYGCVARGVAKAQAQAEGKGKGGDSDDSGDEHEEKEEEEDEEEEEDDDRKEKEAAAAAAAPGYPTTTSSAWPWLSLLLPAIARNVVGRLRTDDPHDLFGDQSLRLASGLTAMRPLPVPGAGAGAAGIEAGGAAADAQQQGKPAQLFLDAGIGPVLPRWLESKRPEIYCAAAMLLGRLLGEGPAFALHMLQSEPALAGAVVAVMHRPYIPVSPETKEKIRKQGSIHDNSLWWWDAHMEVAGGLAATLATGPAPAGGTGGGSDDSAAAVSRAALAAMLIQAGLVAELLTLLEKAGHARGGFGRCLPLLLRHGLVGLMGLLRAAPEAVRAAPGDGPAAAADARAAAPAAAPSAAPAAVPAQPFPARAVEVLQAFLQRQEVTGKKDDKKGGKNDDSEGEPMVLRAGAANGKAEAAPASASASDGTACAGGRMEHTGLFRYEREPHGPATLEALAQELLAAVGGRA